MEREEIIKNILVLGYQLTSDALDYLFNNPNLSSVVIEFIKKNKPKILIIDEEFIKKIIVFSSEIRVLKAKHTINKILTVQEFVSVFNQRYNEIKKIISENEELKNLILINKISQKMKEFSIIGIVLEKNIGGKELLVEDESGKIEVYLNDLQIEDFNEVLEDEVIGLLCESKDDKIIVKKTIYPNIPFKKEIAKTANDFFCLFVSDFHIDDEKFNIKSYKKFLAWIKEQNNRNLYIFILGDVSKNIKNIEELSKNLTNGVKIFLKGEIDPPVNLFDKNFDNEVLLQIENVTIFLQHGEILDNYRRIWNIETEKIVLKLLKKRHLIPTFGLNKKIYDDIYFLKDIPDIIVSGHTHSPGVTNYKGVTIISNGSFVSVPVFYMVNLKTREINKLDFT